VTHTVVITGAAGRVGRELRTLLAAPGRVLRLVDIAPQDPLADGEHAEIVTGSYTDEDLMERVLAGADGIVHLGGVAGERPWADILATNIDGTQRLLESARAAGVMRVVIASSHHVAGNYQRSDADAVEDGRPVLSAGIRPRPDTYYGVSKAAMEALGSLYADQFGMHIVAIRIGTTAKPPLRGRQNLIWISYRDLASMTEAALGDLDVPASRGFAVWWGVSRNSGSWLAHEPARSAGFVALDNASAMPSELLSDEPVRLGGTWTRLALGERP
jgi:uronate dehydrogenase